ncbi:hypothetical protein T484DRAFT_1889480 [Baffinella frigidus]|nr:hypothetical protein T484DRAFT_1889480 [Cryptophyta sp. CCMP2293]
MAPSSPTNASTHRSSLHTVIIDGIHKKDSHRIHISARRLSVTMPANVHDETAAMEQSAPSSPGASNTDGWEMDEEKVERPEDICELSGDEWDLEEAVSSAGNYETAPANYFHLDDTAFVSANVWQEAEESDNTEFLQLLDYNAAPASDLEDDAAGIWAAPQDCSF